MERSYMKQDVLIEMDFITERHMGVHSHENYEMMFVISGEMQIMVEEDSFQLKSGDMLVVNVDRKHSYDSSPDFLAGRFLVSNIMVRELLGQSHILFWCNSTVDHNDAYDDMRRIIVKLFNQSLRENRNSRLYINSLHYQLLYILSENFLLTEKDVRTTEADVHTRDDDRMETIFSYIRANYRQNITLDELAGHLYLSPTYVSKYIKQKCGINFSELMNNVRLGRAMQDLMYTDDSVMRVAMENGFASVAAYNKVFKDVYHMTPSEFRKKRKTGRKESEELEKEQKKIIHRKVEEYLDRNPNVSVQDDGTRELAAEINMETDREAEWDGYCCKMINAGTAADLLNVTFQEQILSFKQKMGFEYVRFWDICSPELYIDIHAPGGAQNYSRLNSVTDFLVRNHLKPYMELGFKPLRILKTTGNALKELNRDDEFLSDDEMCLFYRKLLENFVNRYGSAEVQTWYFEYWEKTGMGYSDIGSYQFREAPEERHREYFHQFSLIAGEFRRCLPSVRIGGGGFPVRLYGEDRFTWMLNVWKMEKEKPDFISLTSYPYIQEKEKNSYYEKQNTDPQFVLHNIMMAEHAMERSSFPQTELHVSEYSFSLSNRNVVNDSCMKGAFMIYNAIACLGRVRLMGHWLFTDAYADLKDTRTPLFGGCGLLTKDGITKPSYFAMEFFNRLYRNVLYTRPNYLVTRSERGSIRLVCHNMKRLNYNYYIMEEDAISFQELQSMMEDREYLTIHVRVKHMKDGIYYIKRNCVNQKNGSVLDKWAGLNMEPSLTMREMDYLKSASTSTISIEEMEITGGVLQFDIQLEPNEIQYIHVMGR
ncbi:MAG: helix-turn-helix domain-containing protein [Clostridiales bacterium]|nr:helix-turn-helix domain-containing protein [Clostridiales bacterium]